MARDARSGRAGSWCFDVKHPQEHRSPSLSPSREGQMCFWLPPAVSLTVSEMLLLKGKKSFLAVVSQ